MIINVDMRNPEGNLVSHNAIEIAHISNVLRVVRTKRDVDVLTQALVETRKVFTAAARQLQVPGGAVVELYSDGPYASLFWHILLRQPINTTQLHGILRTHEKEPTCLEDVLYTDAAAHLSRLNTGMHMDTQRNWLTISFSRAKAFGLFDGWKDIPAWVKLVHRLVSQRVKTSTSDSVIDHWYYQQSMARASSLTVPRAYLERIGYCTKELWTLVDPLKAGDTLDYNDLVVLDLSAALPLFTLEIDGNQWIAPGERDRWPALDLRVVTFRPSDKKQMDAVYRDARKDFKEEQARLRRERARQRLCERRRRLDDGEDDLFPRPPKLKVRIARQSASVRRATAIIRKLQRQYSVPTTNAKRFLIRGSEVRREFLDFLNEIQRNGIKHWALSTRRRHPREVIPELLDTLRELLNEDPTLPQEYRLWFDLETADPEVLVEKYRDDA